MALKRMIPLAMMPREENWKIKSILSNSMPDLLVVDASLTVCQWRPMMYSSSICYHIMHM